MNRMSRVSAAPLGCLRKTQAIPMASSAADGVAPIARVHFASLDAVRAVLAVAVLLYHLGGTIALPKYFGFDGFANTFGFGGARVPFFFVLSGFLLAHLHAQDVGQPRRLWPFLRRRLLRIYPTYWLILLLVIAATLMVPALRGKVPADPAVLLQTFLLLPQEARTGGPTGAPLIIVAWTLHYEMAFYALLAAFVCSRLLGTLCLLALGLNALDCSSGGCGLVRGFLANPYLSHFGIGAAAGLLAQRLPPLPNARALATGAIVAYVLLALSVDGHVDIRGMADPNVYFALLASLVLICLVSADSTRPRRPLHPGVKMVADASYPLYLLHFPLISVCCRLLVAAGLSGVTGAVLAFVGIGLLCLVLAIAFHRWVEKPLLRWLR